ncbi:MAG: hypothetical protein IJU72_00265 [Bacteroidales bacterium]|nr:hypothetical protein [Bacteroidales bacterium]
MNRIKPATAIVACAGIHRMEFGQPPALGMRTCGGKGAGQWLFAMGCANKEHPSRKAPCAAGGALQGAAAQRDMVSTASYINSGMMLTGASIKTDESRGFHSLQI